MATSTASLYMSPAGPQRPRLLSEDRFLALFEHHVAEAAEVALEAFYEREQTWRERVRGGLAALLGFLDDEPELAQVCVVDALGRGRRVLERRAQVLDALAAVVAEGRAQPPAGRELPDEGGWGPNPSALTAELVIGGVFSVIHSHLLDRSCSRAQRRAPLLELLGPLMNVVVAPYLGAVVAAEELTRPAPLTPRASTRWRDMSEAA